MSSWSKFSVVLLLCGTPAAAQDVRVRNTGDDAIYNLYAWATDLSPSTVSLIAFPIGKGEVKTVDVDNDYADCRFTFQIDRNNPDLRRKHTFRNRQKRLRHFTVIEANICKLYGKPVNLPDHE